MKAQSVRRGGYGGRGWDRAQAAEQPAPASRSARRPANSPCRRKALADGDGQPFILGGQLADGLARAVHDQDAGDIHYREDGAHHAVMGRAQDAGQSDVEGITSQQEGKAGDQVIDRPPAPMFSLPRSQGTHVTWRPGWRCATGCAHSPRRFGHATTSSRPVRAVLSPLLAGRQQGQALAASAGRAAAVEGGEAAPGDEPLRQQHDDAVPVQVDRAPRIA